MSVTGGDEAWVEGRCDARFAAVKQAFSDNFTKRGEPGAAVSIAMDGRPVVDLWAGWADIERKKRWTEDTLVNVFSVGKAVTAICVLQQVERGLLDLDAPFALQWPEFTMNGKEAITLRQVLSHRAGLPAVRNPLPDGAMLDWPVMTEALAAERPWWQPGAKHGYHVNTFGYLVGESARRASGKTIGALLRENIAGPLGADFHIGLPEPEHARVAEFHWPQARANKPETFENEFALMRWNTYWNPPGLSGAGWVNRREWRLAEIPSTNGHATARGVARIYSALAHGGAIGGRRILSEEMLREAVSQHSYGTDVVLERTTRFGLGFQLAHPERRLGPNPGAFGHFGAGGSLGFCDPDAGLAFGYITCDMGPRWQNPRNQALIDAAYACL